MTTSLNLSGTGNAAGESGVLARAFSWASDKLLRGGWLRGEFGDAADNISPVNWLKEKAETLLGRDFLRAAIGMAVNFMDKSPENANDDNGLVTGLKSWRMELGVN